VSIADKLEQAGWADFLRYARDDAQVQRLAPELRDALMRVIEEDGARLWQELVGEARGEAERIRREAYETGRAKGVAAGEKEARRRLAEGDRVASRLVRDAQAQAKRLTRQAEARIDRMLAPVREQEQRAKAHAEAIVREAEAKVERMLRPVRASEEIRALQAEANRRIERTLAAFDAEVVRWQQAAKQAIARDLAAAREERQKARLDAVRIRTGVK
jgi:hypothetical protein